MVSIDLLQRFGFVVEGPDRFSRASPQASGSERPIQLQPTTL